MTSYSQWYYERKRAAKQAEEERNPSLAKRRAASRRKYHRHKQRLTEQTVMQAAFLAALRAARATLAALSKRHLTKQKGPPIMDRATELTNIVKQHGGIAAMAKLFIAKGEPLGGVTEAEFTQLIDAEAQATRKSGERPNQAFARFYNDAANLELRKAHQITRGF